MDKPTEKEIADSLKFMKSQADYFKECKSKNWGSYSEYVFPHEVAVYALQQMRTEPCDVERSCGKCIGREQQELYELAVYKKLGITSQRAYQLIDIEKEFRNPSKSRTTIETEPCEWCEIANECEYEVTFFEGKERWAHHRSLLPNYCPNCGRKLKGET